MLSEGNAEREAPNGFMGSRSVMREADVGHCDFGRLCREMEDGVE